jgi:hypothetical protein
LLPPSVEHFRHFRLGPEMCRAKFAQSLGFEVCLGLVKYFAPDITIRSRSGIVQRSEDIFYDHKRNTVRRYGEILNSQ